MNKDYYRVLGLAENAEDVVIRAAFRILAHRYHPDKRLEEKEAANRMMVGINEAYNTLSDPLLKAAYDQKRGTYEAKSDFYYVLGVLDNVDVQMLRAAYEALSKKYENLPSHNLCEKRLIEINQAYQILTDSAQRKAYDIRQRSLYDFQSRQGHRLCLWKVYLVYNLVFYFIMTVIYVLV